MQKPDAIDYAVQGFDKLTESWVIRPAYSADKAREMANIFVKADELITVSFGWNGREPTVEAQGNIPLSIEKQYTEWHAETYLM